MEAVTREEFAELAARVRALEAAIAPVLPAPARQVQVTAVPSDGAVQVSWTATEPDQVASWLVGRDGTDVSGAGPWAVTEGPSARGRLFTKLKAEVEYEFTVAATYADGEVVKASAKAAPAAVDPPVDTGGGTEPTERRVPLVSRRDGGSQLPFNRLYFRDVPPTMAHARSVEQVLGGKVDGFLTFPGRSSWRAFRENYGDAKAMLESGGLVVWSMPHAPTSEGPSMNQRGANDAYRGEQRDLGAWWADNGYNSERFVVRVDWEFNGNWYDWSANRAGGPEALKLAIRNFVTNVRAGGATNVRFNLCANKGPSQAKAHFPEVFPGAEWIDVLGVDQYDHWGPSYTDADWARELGKTPSIQYVADLAAEQGIQWSWDEGGNSWDARSGGRDNPFYWRKRWEFLAERADTCAWDNTYLHAGAPATLRHDFASNPRSAEEYRRLYQPA